MTSSEITEFFESENVQIGDSVRIDYRIMFTEQIVGKVVYNYLVAGNSTVNTDSDFLVLNHPEPYLILNTYLSLTGARIQYIENIEVVARRGLYNDEYLAIKNNQKFLDGDIVHIIQTDNSMRKLKIISPEIHQNYKGEYCLIFEAIQGGAESILISDICKIFKQ